MTDVITQAAARVVMPIAALLALFLLIRAQTSVGGGFLAAVVFSLGAVFRRIAFPGARRIPPLVGAATTAGCGMLVMLATGFAGYAWGSGFLDTATAHLELPVVGPLALHSTLLFEIGVAVTAFGVSGAVAQELGEPP